MKNRYLIVMLSMMLSACQYIPTVSQKELGAVYIKKTEAEAQVLKVKDAYTKDLTDNLTRLSTTKDTVIRGQDEQIQAGANALYTITQTAQVLPAPGSSEFIRDRAGEGFSAMGKPPTIKEIIEGGERLRKYLTTYKNNDPVEIEKLRVEHARLVAENGVLVKTTDAAKEEVKVVAAEKTKIENKYTTDVAAAQQKLNEANDSVIGKEKQRADAATLAQKKAENVERLKKQLMLWCGIGAVLALVGAIYSPFGKSGLATIAAILAAAAVIIPFITAAMVWIVLIGGGVIAAGVGGVFFYRHNLVEKTNTNLVNAIEDTNTTPNATPATLKTNLKEWNTTYVKNKAGEVVTKADVSVEKYIKEKLMATGRLDPNKKP